MKVYIIILAAFISYVFSSCDKFENGRREVQGIIIDTPSYEPIGNENFVLYVVGISDNVGKLAKLSVPFTTNEDGGFLVYFSSKRNEIVAIGHSGTNYPDGVIWEMDSGSTTGIDATIIETQKK